MFVSSQKFMREQKNGFKMSSLHKMCRNMDFLSMNFRHMCSTGDMKHKIK